MTLKIAMTNQGGYTVLSQIYELLEITLLDYMVLSKSEVRILNSNEHRERNITLGRTGKKNLTRYCPISSLTAVKFAVPKGL